MKNTIRWIVAGAASLALGAPAFAGPGSAASGASSSKKADAKNMQAYRVDKISGDEITLTLVPGSSEKQNQSGRELKISKADFEKVAATLDQQAIGSPDAQSGAEGAKLTPHEGDVVLVAMGSDGKPDRIQLLSAQPPPQGSQAPNQGGGGQSGGVNDGSGNGGNNGQGSGNGNSGGSNQNGGGSTP